MKCRPPFAFKFGTDVRITLSEYILRNCKLDREWLPVWGDEDGSGSLRRHELVAAFLLRQFSGVLVNVDVGHPLAQFLLPVWNKRRRNHDQKMFCLICVNQRTYKRRHLHKNITNDSFLRATINPTWIVFPSPMSSERSPPLTVPLCTASHIHWMPSRWCW